MKKVILASASPRRRELLAGLDVDFEVVLLCAKCRMPSSGVVRDNDSVKRTFLCDRRTCREGCIAVPYRKSVLVFAPAQRRNIVNHNTVDFAELARENEFPITALFPIQQIVVRAFVIP